MLLLLTCCAETPVTPSDRRREPTPTPTPTPGSGSASCEAGQYIDKAFADATITKNVLYSEIMDQYGLHELQMDIYQPGRDTAPHRPAIVWVHGGSFEGGGKAQLSEYATEFALRGYVTAAIEYRLLRKYDPNVRYSMAVDLARSDAQAAVRFLRAHAEDLALDSERIAIAGWSAGSITAFHVGYAYESIGDNTDNPGFPHTVLAVMGLDGVLTNPAAMQPGDPPFILFRAGRGVDDNPASVPALIAQATALGIPHELYVVRGASHNDLVKPPYIESIVAQAAPFMSRYVACR